MLRRKIVVMLLIVSNLLIMPYSSYGKETDDLTLYSKSAALIDGLNGTLLYGKDENVPLSMASTTKIMTCIIALEYGNLDDYIVVSDKAKAQPKVHLGMKKGEEFLMKDLLYSLMLESHNDSAVSIAEGVSGNVEDFAKLMNDKAAQLGLTDTYFITPNGLDKEIDEKYHHTTALELAKIMRYCICTSPKKEEFIEITSTPAYTFTNKDKTRTFSCTNHNLLFDMMDGVISGKTGYTSKAGYCYVGALENEGRIYIVSLLACGWPNHKNYKWSDAKTLLNWGKEKYFYISLNSLEIPDDIPVRKNILFKNTLVDSVDVNIISNITFQKNQYEIVTNETRITYEYHIDDEVYAPYYTDSSIGYINFYIDSELIKTYSLHIETDILEPGYIFYLKRVIKLFIMG